MFCNKLACDPHTQPSSRFTLRCEEEFADPRGFFSRHSATCISDRYAKPWMRDATLLYSQYQVPTGGQRVNCVRNQI